MKSKKYVFLVTLVSISLLSFAGPNEDLVNACKQGDLAAAKAAIEAGADVNAKDAGGSMAIDNAFLWPEITQLLLDNGADPNGGNYPPLLQACAGYSTDVVKLLLDAGADPNKPGISAPTDMYRNLIDAEKAKGKKKANKALIKAWEDAMANAKPTVTYPANAFLIGTNHVPALKMMLEKGMKIEYEDGTNALQTFVTYCNSREMRKEEWTKNGAAGYARFGYTSPTWMSNLPDERNGTATEMLDLLLSTGVDFNKVNANGFTPLCETLKGTILAVENTKQGKINVATMLIEKGADVNASSTMTNSNWTYYPLCLATEIGDISLVKLLVDKGADLNKTVRASTVTLFSSYASVMGEGGDGYTAVTIAIIKDLDDIANYLIDQGADLTIGVHGFATLESGKKGLRCLTIVQNKSPIYWAVERGDGPLIKKIATHLSGKRLPAFSARQMADVGNADANDMTVRYTCVKFSKSTYSPSDYAYLIGDKEVANYLAGMKL